MRQKDAQDVIGGAYNLGRYFDKIDSFTLGLTLDGRKCSGVIIMIDTSHHQL